MSYEKESQEYHLTPNGWTQGSYNSTSGFHDPIPIPEDRVLTIVCAVERDYGDSPPEYSVTIKWQSDDVSTIANLKAKFAEKPNWYGYSKMTNE